MNISTESLSDRRSASYRLSAVVGVALLLCCSFAASRVEAQATFFKSYGGPLNDQANSVIPVTKGLLAADGVVVAGFTESMANGQRNKDAWVLWIKPDGTVDKGFKYGQEAADEVINEIEEVPSALDPIGGYIAIGTRRIRTATNTVTNIYSEILLIRINPDGTVLWEKMYSSTSPHSSLPSTHIDNTGDEGLRVECDVLIKRDHDFGFILSGRSQTEDLAGGPLGAPNGYIIKVDKDGKFLWDSRFEDNDGANGTIGAADATFGDVRVTSNGYVFAGFNSPGTVYNDNDPFYGFLPAPLDAPQITNNPLTVTRYGYSTPSQKLHQGTYSILPLASTPGFFSVGNWRTTPSDTHIYALNMDANLATPTFHFYEHRTGHQVRSLICKRARASVTYNSAPAVIAAILDLSNGPDAGMILMDETGALLWARQYGTTGSDISLDACQQVLDKDSFYVVGNTKSTNGDTDLLVIKTDREGKLDATAQACLLLDNEALRDRPSPYTAATVGFNLDKAYTGIGVDDRLVEFAPTPAIPCATPIVNACTSQFTAPNVCPGEPVVFSDASTGATTWNWNFGDGNTATQQNPTHTYTASGSYAVTLSVNGGACTVTHTVLVAFDCFSPPAFDDTKARLDIMAIELQRTPDATGYIIVYAGRGSRPGRADYLGRRGKEYLVRERRLDANRVVVINGGYRASDYIELWIVPRGAPPPQPNAARAPGQVYCTDPGSIMSVTNTSSGNYEYVVFKLKKPLNAGYGFSVSTVSGPFTESPSGNPVTITGPKYERIKFSGITWTCPINEDLSLPKIAIKDVKRIEQDEGIVDYVVGYRAGSRYVSTISTTSGLFRTVRMKFKK